MKERHTKTLTTFSEEQSKKKVDNVLLKARKEVEINGNGTSGYVVKCWTKQRYGTWSFFTKI
jgi:hypothetical protein